MNITKRIPVLAVIGALLFSMVAAAQLQQSPQAQKQREEFRQRLERDPSDGPAWYGLGVASLQLNDLATAINALQKSVDLGNNLAFANYNLACAYARSGDKQKALAALAQVASLAPRLALQANKDSDLAGLRGESAFQQTLATAARAIAPCQDDAQNRQFDFWAGEWDVFDKKSGAKVGTSRVDTTLDGCLLIENWEGSVGGTGKSFNAVNPATGKWQQYWVASNGTVTLYDGEFTAGAMRYVGSSTSRGRPASHVRLTFTPLPDGTVEQHGEVESPSTGAWTTQYDFIYKRKPKAAGD